MFSPRAIKKALADPRRALAVLCQRYLDHYKGNPYDFFRNGESNLLDRFAQLAPRTVFDVGANVGAWSLVASKLFPSAVIHCFELSERTFKTLQSRVGGSAFVLNNMGLSDKAGIFEYKDYGDNSELNTIVLDAVIHDRNIEPRLVRAELTTGNDYCGSRDIDRIDFLKIDVEGAEHLVLRGFSDLLGKRAIRAIQFEYGYSNGDAKFLMRDFYKLFSGYGYVVARVQKGPLLFRDWIYQDNDFTSGPNYLAVRHDDTELLEVLSNGTSVKFARS